MSYGKIISGGKQMSKGLSKNINDKLDSFAKGHAHAASIANAVSSAYKAGIVNDPHTNNVKGGTFTKPKVSAQN
jgi:hypothetical protein